MRNLKLQYCNRFAVNVPEGELRQLLLNPNTKANNAVYVATNDKLYKFADNNLSELVELPGIVGIEYLALEEQICLATEGGEVITVDPNSQEQTDATVCDVGIECMTWSPDQEVVVFVTKAHNVVVMTCTFDPIAEHALADECTGEGQFINVGWGKKETQFHGSAGKTAAKEKSDFQAPTNMAELPQNVDVTWRADGKFFAVSFVSDAVGRMFKVFDKEGKLNFTSERLNDLQPAIAWRPSGTWIAVPQLLPNKSTVALFEKNGLRHREIVLPFSLKKECIRSLKWSPDSDILVIETQNTVSNSYNLYLYTIGNYHWYLKQVLSFSAEDAVAAYSWDNKFGEEKTLHVLLKSGKYSIYRWHFFIDKLARTGIVAVIDGHKLLLTDFSKAVIPPPMSNRQLEIESYINACDIIKNSKGHLQLCLYDSNQKVHIYKSLPPRALEFGRVALLEPNEEFFNMPLELGNMFWFNDDYFVAATSLENMTLIFLLSVDLDMEVFRIESSLQVSGVVMAVANGSTELDQFFVQTLEGKVQQVSLKHDYTIEVDRTYVQLEHPADQLKWFTSLDLLNSGLISLKNNQCLYVDAYRIATDVTSFCLAGNYLLYTKLASLVFLRLVDRTIVDERRIERGGKLVTTIVGDARTVLQMPRGNLEAICPRVLSLEIVGCHLNNKEYNIAMNILRKERINLNIICDHNMQTFVDSLDVFLSEIKNPNWLNLFLSDLQNEDFTKTMYASNYRGGSQTYPEGFKIEQKVFYLCEKLCERMEQHRDVQRFRLPIITAYVKIGKLEKALELIWLEKKQATSSEDGSSSAEDTLKYLLYMVDVNELYNVALGTYDFGLVLFVAQKSQKDPKEFLPFLNELKSHEVNFRKFKIDEYLKRYEKALSNVSQCGPEAFMEALVFIKRHALFRDALKYYSAQPSCYQEICLAFGDHLRANGKLENASIMYERGGNVQQALVCAKHVLDWQRTLVLARTDAQDVKIVALSLVPLLEENNRHEEAFELLKSYNDDFTEALLCLLRGKHFLRAIFETRNQENQDNIKNSIDKIIIPELQAHCSVLESKLQADRDMLLEYKTRLLTLREIQAKQKQICDENFDSFEVDESDLLSDTTSLHSSRYTGSSRGTGKTFRSSKNRRKHERKLLSLKPGNPFEDIALIDALYNHIIKIVSQPPHIRDTCKALLEVRCDELAAALQRRFSLLLRLVQESLDEIWIPEMMTAQQFLTGPNIDYTQLKNEQRYGMINPQKRFKPLLNIIDWEHEILR